jgi:hypothetical protein
MVVKKIPRDHKGLYLSVPFTHGKQSNISDLENTHIEVGRDTPLKPRAKCFTTRKEEYNPDIKTNLMSGKIEGGKDKMDKIIVCTFKLRGTEKEIERVKARIAALSVCEECVSLHLKEKGGEKKKNGKESVK